MRSRHHTLPRDSPLIPSVQEFATYFPGSRTLSAVIAPFVQILPGPSGWSLDPEMQAEVPLLFFAFSSRRGQTRVQYRLRFDGLE